MKLLITTVVVVLALSAVGAVIAIDQGLPAEFGGKGDADNVAEEFVTRGTAMSPPLAPLIILGALTGLAFLRNLLGTLSLAGIAAIAVLFLVGGIAEPNHPAGSDLPAALHPTLKVAGVTASIAMGTLAARELVRRVARTRD